MAGTKRIAEEMPQMNRSQLLYSITQLESPRDKALASFIYLTGARVSELLGTNKTIRKFQKNEEGEKELLSTRVVEIQPLRKENIEIRPDDNMVIVHNVPCLKRRDKIPKRNIPIIITEEKEFLKYFIDYWETLAAGVPIFDITRQRAWQILNDKLDIYNHYLIHQRCTHLVVNKHFTDMHLQRFRGWADTRMSAIYTHLDYQDIANKMR